MEGPLPEAEGWLSDQDGWLLFPAELPSPQPLPPDDHPPLETLLADELEELLIEPDALLLPLVEALPLPPGGEPLLD